MQNTDRLHSWTTHLSGWSTLDKMCTRYTYTEFYMYSEHKDSLLSIAVARGKGTGASCPIKLKSSYSYEERIVGRSRKQINDWTSRFRSDELIRILNTSRLPAAVACRVTVGLTAIKSNGQKVARTIYRYTSVFCIIVHCNNKIVIIQMEREKSINFSFISFRPWQNNIFMVTLSPNN